MAGGQDHPLIPRLDNAWLVAWQQLPFDATTFPGKIGLDDTNHFLAPVTVEGYGIDAKRLTAKGVASLAPVASNAAEHGRAKNRRVERVLP